MRGLGARLHLVRTKSGLSTRRFASALEGGEYLVSHTTVRGYENGKGAPAAYVEAVSRICHVNPRWLLTGAGLFTDVEPPEIEAKLRKIVDLVADFRLLPSRTTAQLDEFFRLSPDPLLILTPDAHMTRWNGALEELIGAGPNHIRGTSFLNRVHEDDREGVSDHFASIVRASRTARCSFRLGTAEGGYREVECNASSGSDVILAVLRVAE